MEEFLEACSNGDLEKIRNLKSSGLDPQSSNEQGENGLHLAISNGHWKILDTLISEIEISPHKITNQGENLYHFIIRAVAASSPSAEDCAEMKQAMQDKWSGQEAARQESQEKKKPERPDCQPPALLTPTAAEQMADCFGDPQSAFAKYIMVRYRVYPRAKSADGMTPEALATSLGVTSIAQYFAKITSTPESLKRLVAYMPDNIFREVVFFL